MSDNIIVNVTENTPVVVSVVEGSRIIANVTDGHVHHNKQAIDAINADLIAWIEAATNTYVHDQMVASAHWTIEHNLDKYPSVSVVDSAGSIVIGDVQYISRNQLIVTFIGEFSGKAYLN